MLRNLRRKARPKGRAFFVGICLALGLSACESATSLLGEREDVADLIAEKARMEKFFVDTGQFELVGYRRFTNQRDPVVSVYIEGDGLAFLSATTISRDPTPRDPVSLRLAARDPSANVAYLARPCQFQSKEQLSRCSYTYWTNGRFAPEVIREMNKAVDAIVQASGASQVRLFGYSGGGAAAALIAARRDDVELLVTAAAPLDHGNWTRVKRFSPLDRSLDAVDDAQRLARIPQVHFAGADDTVVPRSVIESYAAAVRKHGGAARVVSVPDTDHWCCWQDRWPVLYNSLAK
tara:strand:- start:135712 stop:136587 length:876 start_codon:yes stop_codon:yes gene_type:complete